MVDWTQGRPTAAAPAGPVAPTNRPPVVFAPRSAAPKPEPESGVSLPLLAGGAAALGGLALLAKLKGVVDAVDTDSAIVGVNALRMQSMLSGFAVPKSILGNVGASAIASMERGTVKPLKEFLSMKTVKDAVNAYKEFGQAGPMAEGATIPYVPTPGRIMGAIDVASRNSLQRGGLSATEAEKAILQSPLTGRVAKAMDSPLARYLIPFRRTPFNQFFEGLDTMTAANIKEHPALNALVYGAGAAHGAATADDPYPTSIGLGTAAAARYGLPYTVAAIAGRQLMGGKGSERLASSALPVSEYGFASGITQPLRPFTHPGIMALLGK